MKLAQLLFPLALGLMTVTADAQTAPAATLKIATLEVSKIVENSQRAKKIRDDHDTAMTAANQKRIKKSAELDKANQELQDMKQKASDPSLSPTGQVAAAAEYRKRLDAVQMDVATFKEALSKEGKDINDKAQDQIEKLAKDVFDVASKVAKSKGYNLVLDISKGRGVIYQELGTDITDEVMRQVDAIPAK